MAYLGNTPTMQGFTPAIDYFSGNGATVAFTLSRPVASVAQVQAVIENVPQNPGTAFTVSGNTITFDGAPPSGTNNIYVYYTSPITQVIAPSQGTVFPSTLSTGGPFWSTAGNVGIGTTSPNEAMTIQRGAGVSAATTYRGNGVTSSGELYVGHGTDAIAYVYNRANQPLIFGTNNTDRMRINAAGQITTPSQPAFFANNPSSGTVNTYFAFNSVKVNRGGHYNSSNGRFTAPVAGVYSFIVSALGFGGSVSRLTFRVNGSDLYSDASAAQCRIDATASGSELPFGSKTAITSLNANDYIQVYYGNDSSSTMENLDWVCFGGQLIG
jgi:hypothetical protein